MGLRSLQAHLASPADVSWLCWKPRHSMEHLEPPPAGRAGADDRGELHPGSCCRHAGARPGLGVQGAPVLSCSLLCPFLPFPPPIALGRSGNWEGRAGFSQLCLPLSAQGFGVQGSSLKEKEGSSSNLSLKPSRNLNLPSLLEAGISLPDLPSPALLTTPWDLKCPGKTTCSRFGKLPWHLCLTESFQ